jgi:two-component system CheB/CheR fusion protein
MIYLGGDLQKKLIPLFHYALNPGGMLFLGTSETVGDFGNLFATVDRKSKLYQRIEDFGGMQRVPLGGFLPPRATIHATSAQVGAKTAFPVKLPLRELTEQTLLQKAILAGALVNGQGDILYMHGRTGMYLEMTSGEVGISNILKMAREGLKRELITALHNAVGTKESVNCPNLRVKTNGHCTSVNLSIHPVVTGPGKTFEASLYVVVLEEVPPSDQVSPGRTPETTVLPVDTDERITALKQEIRAKEDYLQAANEELETSNEELKSSNEEMQSVNEELQSTNEELETSKEELQSVNEELATVNSELQTKVLDLSRTNNDMNNLLAGTGIGTVFVDMYLRILRFTPTVSKIINLILSDVGRPVGHIVANLVGYDRLSDDTQAVLDSLIPKEVDVQTTDGKWYTMRIQPYRTLDNVIEGAVITFVNITEMKQVAELLRKANEPLRSAVVMRDAHDAITAQDLNGQTLAWNPGAVRMYGWSEAEALGMNVHDRIPEGLREEALAKQRQLSQAEILEPYLAQRIAKNGSVVEVSIISTALVNEVGKMYGIATTERARETKMSQATEAHHGSAQ